MFRLAKGHSAITIDQVLNTARGPLFLSCCRMKWSPHTSRYDSIVEVIARTQSNRTSASTPNWLYAAYFATVDPKAVGLHILLFDYRTAVSEMRVPYAPRPSLLHCRNDPTLPRIFCPNVAIVLTGLTLCWADLDGVASRLNTLAGDYYLTEFFVLFSYPTCRPSVPFRDFGPGFGNDLMQDQQEQLLLLLLM